MAPGLYSFTERLTVLTMPTLRGTPLQRAEAHLLFVIVPDVVQKPCPTDQMILS